MILGNRVQKRDKAKKHKDALLEFRKKAAYKKRENKTLSEIEEFVDFSYHFGYAEAMINVFFILHDKYGFGKKRLMFLLNYLEDYHAEYGKDGTVTLDDKAEVLKQECGLNIDTVEMEIVGQHYWKRGTAMEVVNAGGRRTVDES